MPGVMRETLRCAVLVALFTATATAQTVPLELPSEADVAIHDLGWNQFLDIDELLRFGLDLVVTFALTAAIAFHPSAAGGARSLQDLERPQMMLICALVGLAVGFLVIEHGYLIGFVIFGIGGLLRFRTAGETADETMRLILATLIGLCVGLALPATAVLVALAAWAVLWAMARRRAVALEILITEGKRAEPRMDLLREALERPGVRVVTIRRAKFKPVLEVVLDMPARMDDVWICEALTAMRKDKGSGIEDWHFE